MPARRPATRLLRAAALGAACSWALTGGAEATTFRGDAGRDVLRGTAGADRLFGRAGHDRLFGGRGQRPALGRSGRDRLVGGPGRDALLGRYRARPAGARRRAGPHLLRARPRPRGARPLDLILDARPGEPNGSCERVTRSGAARAKPDAFLVAAGDIADCKRGRRRSPPGWWTACRAPWRRSATPATRTARPTSSHAATSRPGAGTRRAPGRRSATTSTGPRARAGYFGYFGAAAGEPRQGLVQLRPRRVARGRAEHATAARSAAARPAREQERWLRADLAAHRAHCTLAYLHHPRFSSGNVHGGSPRRRAAVARAPGRRRRAGAGRPRPRLRALRAPDRRPARSTADAACASSWSARAGGRCDQFGTPEPQQRGARQHRLGSAVTCGCAPASLRLAVRGPARQLLHATPGTGACH